MIDHALSKKNHWLAHWAAVLTAEPTWRAYRASTLFLVGLVSLVLFGIDYVTGPVIHVSFFYVLLVGIMAWFLGAKITYPFAIVFPLLRIAAHFFWTSPWSVTETLVNVLIQIGILLVSIYLVGRVRALVTEVRTLKGNLSICTHCTRIRNERGKWEPIEQYISRQSEVRFTHGICPECSDKYTERGFADRAKNKVAHE